jgi:hypothetical protein
LKLGPAAVSAGWVNAGGPTGLIGPTGIIPLELLTGSAIG